MEGEQINLQFLESFLPVWDKITHFSVKECQEPGICLATEVLLVKVEFENGKKPMHLYIKPFPSCAIKQQWLRKLKVFPKEIFFYDTILPELKRLQNNCDNNEDKIALRLTTPQLLAGVISDVSNDSLATFMALTNLKMTRGFKRPSLYTGLDYNHCKLVVCEIAKLHALSWVYRKSKAIKSLQVMHPMIEETFFSENNKDDLQELLTTNFDIFESLVEKSLGNDSDEMKKIRGFRRDFANVFIKYVNNKGLNESEMENEFLAEAPAKPEEFLEEPWAVGSHGDLKQSNLLFRYKGTTSEANEVALLDFQSYRECCPTIDLAYFIYTSTDYETRENHLNDLLQLYHDRFIHLCSLLKKEPYPGFNTRTLQRRFHRAKVFGLLSAVLVLPCLFLTNSQQNETAADANGNFSDFLTFAKRAEEDLNVMQSRFSDLARELCKQGVL